MRNTDNDDIDLLFMLEDKQDSVRSFAKRSAPKEDLPNAREVLADLAMDKAMDGDLQERLANDGIRGLVIEVPNASWVEPIMDSVNTFTNDKVHGITRTSVPSPRERTDDYRLAERLNNSRTVVGVSPDPDRALPDLLLSVAERRVTVAPADAELVMGTIRRCQAGDIPARAAELRFELLNFDEITSIIVKGGQASDSVERLEQAIDRKLRIGAKSKALPKLEDAIEYGKAREWALDLRVDLADVRKGLIDFDQVDRGAVFYGPPGTGKTLLAQMLGEACGIPTVVTGMSEFFASTSGHLDTVIKAQRKAFDEARSKAPSILFLDEINMVPNVDNLESRHRDYWMPVVLDFYQLLDGAMSDREGVIVIGATNRLEDINPALLRPGRLERAIHIGPPDAEGLKRIMRHHLGDDLRDENLDVLAMLGASNQATGAIVMEQVRAARRRARRAKREMVVDDLKSQIVREDPRDDDGLRRSAIHEAGHAVAGVALNAGDLESVSILPMGGDGGFASFSESIGETWTRSTLDAKVVTMLAGRAAEELILGEPSHGAGGGFDSDLGRATKMLAVIYASMGLGGSLIFRAEPDDATILLREPEFRQRVHEALSALYDRAHNVLQAHRSSLLALADALVEKRYLDGSEAKAIIEKNESAPLAETPNLLAAE